MNVYYGIFYPDEDGWGVRFPDAPSVNTCGDTIEQALEMAVDALSAIMAVGRKGREYNAPRGYLEIEQEAGKGELIFPVVPSEKTMDEYRPKKRINVMVPVDLLDRVNDRIKGRAGMDRSKFICTAVEKCLSED